MLTLPPPKMARIVAAHLASFCRTLLQDVETREDCKRCLSKRRQQCDDCKGVGHLLKSEDEDFIGPRRKETCTSCDGKGEIFCGWCEDDIVSFSLVTILGVTVLASDVLALVMRQPDLFPLCVDGGRLWFPGSPTGIVPFVPDSPHHLLVDEATYETRQLSIFDVRQP